MTLQRSSTPLSTHADAYAYSVKLLASRPRSVAQIRNALEQRDTPPEIVESVVTELHHTRALDDAAFAVAWVESRRRTRQYSATRLSHELRQRGVSEEHIETALSALIHEDETQGSAEDNAARTLAERKLRQMRTLPPHTQARRLLGALQRAGYSHAHATRVVLSVLENAPEDL